MTADPPTVVSTSRCRTLSLGRFDEARGSLCVAEVGRQIPFAIARTYWIFDVPPGEERACHAHRRQHEVVIAVRGSFCVHCDDGDVTSHWALGSPDVGLFLPAMVFHRLDGFSADAVCLVLASGPYEPKEYVNDSGEFARLSHRP